MPGTRYLANNKIDETDLATAMGSWIFQLPPYVSPNLRVDT